MVNLDNTTNPQTGSMVLHEDGSIISSTGDLSSSEQTAQTILGLLTHSLQVDFNGHGQNGYTNSAVVGDGGGGGSDVVGKWNRITVSYPSHTYTASLSNKRIHVTKKDSRSNQPIDQNENDQL